VSDTLTVQSHKGPYTVHFGDGPLKDAAKFPEGLTHILVDANVARLYQSSLRMWLDRSTTVVMEAFEDNKSLEGLVPLFHQLVKNGIRRDHTLVAIGGGIVQDAACFMASTLLRGLPWQFVPTTLLAQADSCIGSKSSINLGGRKNLLGTFYPPQSVFVDAAFLNTLEPKDIRSGVGEIAKVHAIAGSDAFDRFAADFERLFTDRAVLDRYIRAALAIKQAYIEKDEFDQGIRNIFNYGHSFGHAIESAANYAVPHGIAVAMGMDAANALSVARGLTPASNYSRMHEPLRALYSDFRGVRLSLDAVLAAMMSDKKNTSSALGVILPIGPFAAIERRLIERDDTLVNQVKTAVGGVLG
jgi:3-dehydroquinate synthase